jgi:prepilin-type N-terminal cleavage/methylation domain-containing protein
VTKKAQRGFTLIELLISVVVFLAVAGAAFSLFAQHVELVTKQQNLSSVNIGLRNAMSQLEMDLANSGQNLVNNVPTATQYFSLGVVIQNNVPGGAGVANCTPNTTTWGYPVSSACFDSLAIINPKLCSGCASNSAFYPYVPVLRINDSADSMSSSTAISGSDANSVDTAIVSTATLAANFTAGDELLVLIPNNTTYVGGVPHCTGNTGPSLYGFSSQSGYCMTTVKLTANATVVGSAISLPSYVPSGSGGQPSGCPGASCSDPLGLLYNVSAPSGVNYAPALSAGPYGTSTNAYIIDLGSGANDIWYSVQQNPANANDPQLMRCLGAPCTSATGQAVTDQVVGFKVGAALWDQGATTDIGSYFYNAANYCSGFMATATSPSAYYNCTTASPYSANNDPFDFTLIRSVRVSLIARTPPKMDPSVEKFTNGFDGGPYNVQQAAVVVDLRNMSNPDLGN